MTVYSPITDAIRAKLESTLGKGNVIFDRDAIRDYSHDEYSLDDVRHFPEVVVKPESTEQVSAIMKIAHENQFAVTPRGGGTGLVGGCIPVMGGAVLSLERMNSIIEIDKENRMAVAEAGITLMDFYSAVEDAGLFFPPHPGDESAFLGGAIATNAGGARAVKYGVMRDFVRGLTAVLADGSILHLGGKTLKNCSGYPLIQLITGSEGTLAIITEAIIRLSPTPQNMLTLLVPYQRLSDAIATVPDILSHGIVPISIEFIQHGVIAPTERLIGMRWPSKNGQAYLMFIVDGPSEDEVFRLSELIGDICLTHHSGEVLVAEEREKQREILAIRSNIYEGLKPNTIEILDLTVPITQISPHIARVGEIAAEYGIWLPSYGHAADGNIHTHIMKLREEKDGLVRLTEEDWKQKYPLVRRLLHEDCIARGGVISGEHCVGLVKKEYLSLALSDKHLEMMGAVKKAFDEKMILNPGKIFDV